MMTVEKVGGISGIERKRFEAGEGRENCARPFPSVAEKAVDAESTCTRRMYANWCRIPFLKIKIAAVRRGKFFAPGECALFMFQIVRAGRNSVRGAMPFGFAG